MIYVKKSKGVPYKISWKFSHLRISWKLVQWGFRSCWTRIWHYFPDYYNIKLYFTFARLITRSNHLYSPMSHTLDTVLYGPISVLMLVLSLCCFVFVWGGWGKVRKGEEQIDRLREGGGRSCWQPPHVSVTHRLATESNFMQTLVCFFLHTLQLQSYPPPSSLLLYSSFPPPLFPLSSFGISLLVTCFSPPLSLSQLHYFIFSGSFISSSPLPLTPPLLLLPPPPPLPLPPPPPP